MNMEEKERIIENKFKEWLNKNEIPFWYIHPNIGFILTDVDKKFGDYFGIPLENFIVVSKNQGIDKLFLEMMEIEKR